MKKFIILIILLSLLIFRENITNFLTTSIFWKVKIWMIGAWGLWKFQYFIWNKSDQPDIEGDSGFEYKNESHLRFQAYKDIMKDNAGREVKPEKWTDENNRPYFIFRVLHELGEIIFIPYDKNKL